MEHGCRTDGRESGAPRALGGPAHRIAAPAVAALLLGGCAALPSGREWGAEAGRWPGLDRVAASARAAATDPHVWVPLAGAAMLQVGDWDRDVSDWAREKTPVFGSAQDALRWSDNLRDSASWANVAAVLAAESGEGWPVNKARGGLVTGTAVMTTSALTGALKSAIARERPDGSDRRSFPSGHASGAAVNTWLAGRNLAFVPVRPAVRQGFDAGLYGIALGTGWARVEGGVHYPADVLAGIALGRFVAAFANDAFLDPRRERRTWTVLIYPRADLNLLAGAL